LASGLVTQADLEAAQAELRTVPTPATASPRPAATSTGSNPSSNAAVAEPSEADKALAEALIRMGRLNSYQAEQLLAGKRKLNLGPYRILDSIGKGGMGEVYKAEHVIMGRIVAVKVLPKSKSTPEAIANFTREIRSQAKLDHGNLVRAFDAGAEGSVYFLVTEYIPGTDLRRYVRARGPLSMNEAATIISQAAAALMHAHQLGLIHRDVKPGNILVTPEGLSKLSDLGLAGWLHEGEDSLHPGKIVGTADYLPPEQILNPGTITPAGDIYSLGCTLYYAVTGKVPYPGGVPREKAHRHCNDTPLHPRHFNPSLSNDFLSVLAGMMQKDPNKRIASADEVVRRLAPWAGNSVPAPTEPDQTAGIPPRAIPVEPAMGGEGGETPSSFADLAQVLSDEKESLSQYSQGTEPMAAADQETLPIGVPRRLATWSRALSRQARTTSPLGLLLALLIPLALIAAVVMLVLMLRSLSG
jgi:serine/threonine protein kinase